ncbi:MAG: helix-turn-helix transcriptional regulator [Magnetococcus sp. DMHC-1]
MEEKGISKAQLAERLGKSRSFVSQVLNGHRNMTLETLAEISYALNLKLKVQFDDREWQDSDRREDVSITKLHQARLKGLELFS